MDILIVAAFAAFVAFAAAWLVIVLRQAAHAPHVSSSGEPDDRQRRNGGNRWTN